MGCSLPPPSCSCYSPCSASAAAELRVPTRSLAGEGEGTAGSTRWVVGLHLPAGRYELVCNHARPLHGRQVQRTRGALAAVPPSASSNRAAGNVVGVGVA